MITTTSTQKFAFDEAEGNPRRVAVGATARWHGEGPCGVWLTEAPGGDRVVAGRCMIGRPCRFRQH